ncbi:MAG TPA: FecR domain-containing protein [Gemmatimonadaceae bacterium]|nr:FecR domain-containing protein [Gemmatimonadaceae bacterium]
MSESVDDLLLDRYVAGECDAAERAHVDRMLAADAALARRIEQIQALRSGAQRMSQSWNVDLLWRELQERRAVAADTHSAPDPLAADRRAERRAASARVMGALPRARRGRWAAVARLAAAVVVAAAAGAGARWYAGQAEHDAPQSRYRMEAQHGRIVSVRLADGSRVTLAAGSALEVPRTFPEGGRDVAVTGQAYFEIAHDSTHPFRVHTRGALTRVLGTKFDVRAYPEDSAVTVVVTEGHVAFGADAGAGLPSGASRRRASGAVPSVTLSRGDRARLVPGGVVRVERGVGGERDLAWMQGRLEFVDTPLRAVVRDVERWYDVHIVLSDSSLASAPVTASFGNEPVDGVLRTLAVSLDVPLRRRGDTAWLGASR